MFPLTVRTDQPFTTCPERSKEKNSEQIAPSFRFQNRFVKLVPEFSEKNDEDQDQNNDSDSQEQQYPLVPPRSFPIQARKLAEIVVLLRISTSLESVSASASGSVSFKSVSSSLVSFETPASEPASLVE